AGSPRPAGTSPAPSPAKPTQSPMEPIHPRIRPPATPLAVRSPYLSTWSAGDTLPGSWPVFWNGRITALTGLVLVDGSVFIWCGTPGLGLPSATQTSLTVTGTRSVYTLQAGPVSLTATFFSPVDPANLKRQCVPMSYITVTASVTDGKSHAV